MNSNEVMGAIVLAFFLVILRDICRAAVEANYRSAEMDKLVSVINKMQLAQSMVETVQLPPREECRPLVDREMFNQFMIEVRKIAQRR